MQYFGIGAHFYYIMSQLNKFIAQSGLCSRRNAELLIKSGDITINGHKITDLTYRVKPTDAVKYKNKIIKPQKKVYILLNKPKGYITTVADEKNRLTVLDLIPIKIKERLYPVGRLDKDTTGLLLITNDGELAQKLSHPSYEIQKVYQVTLDKPLTQEEFQKIKHGVRLEDGFIKPDSIKYQGNKLNSLTMTIHSGKNRIVRRIFEHFDYKAIKLDRIGYAGLSKKSLSQGAWRYLNQKEINSLLEQEKDTKP